MNVVNKNFASIDNNRFHVLRSGDIVSINTLRDSEMINNMKEINCDDSFQRGIMTEALSNNTRALNKLTELVEESSRSISDLSNRQSKIEDTLDKVQVDIKRNVSISTTGHTNEEELKKRFQFLDKIYQKDQDTNNIKKHAKNVLAGAIVVSFFWWGFNTLKEIAFTEILKQVNHKTEIIKNR